MRTLTAPLVLGFALLGGSFPVHSFELKGVHSLPLGEEVFAYARISGSGRFLVYASYPKDDPRAKRAVRAQTNDPSAPARYISIEIMKVVDLVTGKVLLNEPGIDGFWSNDAQRLIYYSQLEAGSEHVAIWHRQSGKMQRNVAPVELGDYYSWGVRDGRDLVLTVQNKYFYFDGQGRAILPASSVVECPETGYAERSLLSRDGRRISTFVDGMLVVRNLTDCENIVNTGLKGAKADLSWNKRYVAFHAPKADAKEGYEIKVVDLKRRTVRTLSGLRGSSLFPSWTRDGRLCFRQMGGDYNGFMMAKQVLSLPERPLPPPRVTPKHLKWPQLFPETPLPSPEKTVALIWATWSPHSADALAELQKLQAELRKSKRNIALVTATDLASPAEHVARLTRELGISLPRIPLAAERFVMTEAVNQIPTTLLFLGERLADWRLGAQTLEQLREWIEQDAYLVP